jgi:predicted alpha/beta-hydrolase family hydrolase
VPAGDAAGPPGAAVVLAHGAGADMTNALLSRVHEGLAARGFPVLKFNFAYTEAGRRAPDPPAKLVATYRAAAAWLSAQPEAAGRPLVLGGKSMGGRIASHLAAEGDPVDGLLFLGYPLHPAGRPQAMRDRHLDSIPAPLLFVTGTRDALCDLALLRPVLERLGGRATLALIEDGDHSFHVRRSSGRDDAAAVEEVIEASARWLEALSGSRPGAAADASRSRPRPSPPAPPSPAAGTARGRPAKSPGPSSSSARGGTRKGR